MSFWKKLLCILSTVCVTQSAMFANFLNGYYQPEGYYENSAPCCNPWYGVVEVGYAWGTHSGVDNPDPSFWDASDQGYDALFSNSPYLTVGYGRSFCDLFLFDVGYSIYQPFHFQKYQVTTSTTTPGFTGTSRTRFFDLDHQNVLFNFELFSPSMCSWASCWGNFTPYVGVGIGVGINRVSNFHTVGFRSIVAGTGIGSTTTIGRPVTTTNFAWQATAGLRFNPHGSALSFDVGYHYYSGGWFKGPTQLVSNSDSVLGGFNNGAAWEGRLRTNQLYIALNFAI